MPAVTPFVADVRASMDPRGHKGGAIRKHLSNITMKFPKTIAFTSCLAGIASAQTQDSGTPTQELTPLVVEANRTTAPSMTVRSLDESREELGKTPGGTEVVDAERYLTGRASTMADTFALSPGVIAQPRFGSDEARLSIRGSGMQRTFHGRGIRLMQDGIPLNLADGGFDMQSVDPLAASHIEILRGGNALTLGASTLGGAINYISSTGLTSPGGAVRLEGGSFDYLRARVEYGFSEGAADGYLSFSEMYQEGFREHSQQDAQRFLGNFGWQIADHVETRLFLNVVRSRSELPGSLTKQELNDDPSQADDSLNGAINYDYRRDYDLFRIASSTTVTHDRDTWEFTGAYSYKDLDHPITPFVGVIDQLSDDYLIGTTFTRDGVLAGRDNRLRAGAFLTYGDTDSATYENDFGSRGALLTKEHLQATNVEGFVEDQFGMGHGFTGILAATASWNRRDSQTEAGTNPSYDRDYHNISPKAGVVWESGDVQVFGNVSGSYEPPTFSETNSAMNANEAQTATTVEIGTRGSHANFAWDATLYASAVKNEFLSLNDAAGTPLGTTNADNTTHQGIEFAGEADLLGKSLEEIADHRLFLRGAATYGRFRFDDDKTYGDNTIAGLPPVFVHTELIWENRQGYYAGPTLDWVPVRAYVDQANTLSADPYALLGFKVGRRVEDGFSWFIEAKNLTDARYAATTGVVADAGAGAYGTSRNFLPGDGRGFFAGIEWAW